MSISSSLARSSTIGSTSVSTDLQVQHLQSQIEDWRTCPTTDPKTKQEKVSRLEAQLDVVKAQLQSRTQVIQAKKQDAGKSGEASWGTRTSFLVDLQA
jgi:hypothetical protein